MSSSEKSIRVQLPDGSDKSVPAGSTPLDVANSISPRLASAAVVARIKPLHGNTATATTEDSAEAAMYASEDAQTERLVDLSTPLHEDVALQLLTEKDPDALKVVRHSAAHVLQPPSLNSSPRPSWATGRRLTPASSTTSTAPRPSRPKT